MRSGVIFDGYPVDRHDLLDGLGDLEDQIEAARDEIDSVLDILIDRDEVWGKDLEHCTDSAESAHRHLDRTLGAIRKTISRLKFSTQ